MGGVQDNVWARRTDEPGSAQLEESQLYPGSKGGAADSRLCLQPQNSPPCPRVSMGLLVTT